MTGIEYIAVRRLAVVAALVLAASAGTSIRAWCDLPFKDIVGSVDKVILVEYRKPRGKPASVVTLEVFKGESRPGSEDLEPADLAQYRPRNGSRYLIALTRFGRIVQYIEGIGACSPVSVVPLRGEKLRADDRFNYDGGHEPMTLDALREDLIRHLE